MRSGAAHIRSSKSSDLSQSLPKAFADSRVEARPEAGDAGFSVVHADLEA